MFKQAFSFNGRITRSEYGISLIIFIIAAIIISYIGSIGANTTFAHTIFIPLLWFLFSQGSKRCHDMNKSGWFQIIPFYIFWMLLANSANEIDESFLEKTKEENQTNIVIKWILIVLFWLIGMILTGGGVATNNVEALFSDWFLILVISSIFILPVINTKVKNGKYSPGVIIRMALGIILIVFLIISTFKTLKYQSDCEGRIASNSSLCYCRFEDMDLNHSDLHASDLTGAVFYNCNLEGSNFTKANLTDVNLSKSNLTNVILDSVILNGANLIGTIGINDTILCNVFALPETELSKYLSSKKIRLESKEVISERLLQVCFNKGISEATLFTQDSSFHPIVLYKQKVDSFVFKDKLPETWLPMATRYCELVACVEKEHKRKLSPCEYTGGHTVTRYEYQLDVKILSAKTGEVISQETFYGGAPECLERTSSSGSIEGSHVKYKEIREWLETFVNPPN